MWLLLLRSPWTYAAIAMLGLGAYAAVQHVGWELEKAAFAQFRAETLEISAQNTARNAQEVARHAQDAQTSIEELQASYAALRVRYDLVRSNSNPSGGRVPDLASAATSLGACPGDAQKHDSAVRRLANLEGRVVEILRAGDTEIAKHRELWELGQKR